MIRSRYASCIAAFLLLSIPLAGLASDGALQGTVEAFRVVPDADGEEQFLTALEATPEDVIEYRLTYRNRGESSLRNISIIDPVPQGTVYVPKSATSPDGSFVVFSIDGGETYSQWPIKLIRRDAEGNDVEVEATPDMVTHIRWTIDDQFPPEHKIKVTYRTVVK